MKMLYSVLVLVLMSAPVCAYEDPVIKRECPTGKVYEELLCKYEQLHDELEKFPQFEVYKNQKARECSDVKELIAENKKLKKQTATLKASNKKAK